MGPAEWQDLLTKRYAQLRDERLAAGSGVPVFALEHGLAEPEVGEVSELIRKNFGELRQKKYGLLWIVHATEAGYGYVGDEYWPTFEERTPGWLFEHRRWLKMRFVEFHESYSGFKPTGRFAGQFSTICWPIAHAILPRDLQRQFARILYEVRYDLDNSFLQDPKRLGDLIAAQSSRASSRFRQIAEQPLLVGQIAAELLLHGQGNYKPAISPVTLTRIRQDLERDSNARLSMQGARAVVTRHVVALERANPGSSTATFRQGGETRPRRLAVPLLELNQNESGDWNLFLETPDFSGLSERMPSTRVPLRDSRCLVAGSDGRPLAGGRVLLGRQRIRLRTVPKGGEPVLSFLPSVPELDNVLREECALQPRTVRVFKASDTGSASELVARVVRPGSRYVLLAEKLSANPLLRVQGAAFSGGQLALLEVPDPVSPGCTALLRELGLNCASTVSVWPAGLGASKWDGEGRVEWLTTDHPLLGVRADFSLESIRLNLSGREIRLRPQTVGSTCFVSLSPLEAGIHELTVVPEGPGVNLRLESTKLLITIRPPEVWRPALGRRGVMYVDQEPATPSLEEFWTGRLFLEVHGPASYPLEAKITFHARNNSQPIYHRQVGLSLPVSQSEWNAKVSVAVVGDKKAQERYDEASKCVITLTGAELGTYSTEMSRAMTSMRWAVSNRDNKTYLRLVNEDDRDDSARVEYFSFQDPDVGKVQTPQQYFEKVAVAEEGGLYFFRRPDVAGAAVVAPRVQRFEDMRFQPRLSSYSRTPESLARLAGMIEMWAESRPAGSFLASDFRSRVVRALQREMFRLVCGVQWATAEGALSDRVEEESISAAINAIASRSDLRMIGVVIQRDHKALVGKSTIELCAWLTNLLRPHTAGTSETVLAQVVELSLRLATPPPGLRLKAQDLQGNLANPLLALPQVAKASRFAALMIMAAEPNHAWDWA